MNRNVALPKVRFYYSEKSIERHSQTRNHKVVTCWGCGQPHTQSVSQLLSTNTLHQKMFAGNWMRVGAKWACTSQGLYVETLVVGGNGPCTVIAQLIRGDVQARLSDNLGNKGKTLLLLISSSRLSCQLQTISWPRKCCTEQGGRSTWELTTSSSALAFASKSAASLPRKPN